jgi:signal transduction histidine kinase/FixJ family two-component response regulator
MVSFPKFKSSKNYQLYAEHSLERWQSVLIWLLFLIILLEGSSFIEYTALPNIKLETIMRAKVLSWGFYTTAILLRIWLMKIIRRHRILIANISDFILFFVILVVLLLATLKIFTSTATSKNPIWVAKESLRFMASYLVLSNTFYNWFYGPLVIFTLLLWTAVYYMILFPMYTKMYLPSYIAIMITILIFGFIFEKVKRNTFEAQIEALNKEKAWKDILNELPEGVLVVNKKREIVYINNAVRVVLNLDLTSNLKEMSQVNQNIEMAIKAISNPRTTLPTETSVLVGSNEPNEPGSFEELQKKIWDGWDSIEVTSGNDTGNYNIYKGIIKEAARDKTVDIKVAMKEFAGQNVVFFIFSDISDRILVDDLKQTIEYKNRLLASVSHELRTPLNGNINFIESAISDSSVPSAITTKFLVPAVRSAKYLLTIINDILDFSQIQSEKLRLFPTPGSLVKTAQEALDLIEVQATKKKLTVHIDKPTEDWDRDFRTDHNRLIQIMTNLLSNALKFTFSGSIALVLEPINEKQIRIGVRDTGIGISEENQQKLFKSFAKVDFENQYLNPQGVGLGLVISNELSKMLGPKSLTIGFEPLSKPSAKEILGGIRIKSQPEKGSLFSFIIEDMSESFVEPGMAIPRERTSFADTILPGMPISASKYVVSKSSTDTPGSDRKLLAHCTCPRILVADDDAFNLLAIENILGSLGMVPASAYNGKEVIKVMEDRVKNPCGDYCKPFQLIFLDCNMPLMDGYECAIWLKELFKESPQLRCPIIACTAGVQSSERKKALDSGMDQFCTKPITRPMIKDMIDTYISGGRHMNFTEKIIDLKDSV